MSVLESISIDMTVVLGAAQVPIRQILKMSRGAMIPLECGHDEPSLIYVNQKLVAKGRVRVDEDQMSIEITEVVRRGAL